jgi:enoyl-CoA hydratase
MTPFKTIEFMVDGNIGILKLNRPERMNAVIEEMYHEIQRVLDETRESERIRALIITGSVLIKNGVEKQAFCAGADLKKHATRERTRAQKRDYIELAHKTTQNIYDFPRPTIAAVNGPARGAGSEMALNCDFLFIAEKASIAFPEIGLATFIGGGVTRHLPQLIGMVRAKELIYSGRVLEGQEAVEMGLALRCHPVDSLLEEAKVFAHTLAEKGPISMAFAKKRLQESFALDLSSVLDLETEAIVSCMDTEDWHEGVAAFNEKRKPIYKGK